MKQETLSNNKKKLGTAPVFFTSISAILGAILFLRFGFAVGTVGFWGTFIIIIIGHLITIPTALAVSEIATNKRVEGGGEYFIISRSFGLKIGSTIGITLFFSQAISIAFYIIAFTEAFSPVFDWWSNHFGYNLPRQIISIPTLFFLAFLILYKGVGSSMKMLYIINFLLLLSLLLFFIGKPIELPESMTWTPSENFGFFNKEKLFVVFAICFPAFTGMTAGVGLSGDLKNSSKSIPLGTLGGTLTGLIIYILVIWKLQVSAPQSLLIEDQLVMSRIALGGSIVIPIGLAAATFSSALGSFIVAPRTLQAVTRDKSLPIGKINDFFSKGKGENSEPINTTILSFFIALIFVAIGSIDKVAVIISMFFLISYGTLCLISFLNHLGSSPSYRPRFKSKWYLSLAGFLLSVWVMFMINPAYTLIAYVFITILYLIINQYNKKEKGLLEIFEGAIFQLNRHFRVYLQKRQNIGDYKKEWRPSAICISSNSFEREKILKLMNWISYQHGFGTYYHLIEGYYSKETFIESQKILEKLIEKQKGSHSALYVDTMISPSYTSAIAQVIQAPSISGMESNMIVFEFDRNIPAEVKRIVENIRLVKAGNFDVCIYASSNHSLKTNNEIHIWIKEHEGYNTNLMILLGYIIMAHPNWSKSQIKIFVLSTQPDTEPLKRYLQQRIESGRLPITLSNIEIVLKNEETSFSEMVANQSKEAGLTMLGFPNELIKDELENFFLSFENAGDILFVNTSQKKEIS